MFQEVFVLTAILAGVYSQIINVGDCPQVEFVKDFDASKYVGKWYEIERYPLIWEFLGKCVTAEYTANDDNTIGVHNEQFNTLFSSKQSINGTAYYDGPQSEARLTVSFPGFLGSNMRGPYWVVGTDYKNYSVVWSCTRLFHFHFLSSWILAREPKLASELLDKAYEIIDKNKISRAYFLRTDQGLIIITFMQLIDKIAYIK